MLNFKTKHFLTGKELKASELQDLIDFSAKLKSEKKQGNFEPYLKNKSLAILFDKPSLRTRFSFAIGMQELGGIIMESLGHNRKSEEPRDLVRVLEGYCDIVMYRTFEHGTLEEMCTHSKIPIINGLSDSHHPCQVLADLLTLKEEFGKLEGLTLTYLGDGNNVLHSLILLLPIVGVNIKYCCPEGFAPDSQILKEAIEIAETSSGSLRPGRIEACKDVREAVTGTNALYTDVWASMGEEKQAEEKEKKFEGFQLNEKLLEWADPNAIVLHCMPMVRGKEISKDLPEHKASRIFNQCENRLHAQKALLVGLLGE